jgi:CxxC motif-containing protein (DUF1111 family)
MRRQGDHRRKHIQFWPVGQQEAGEMVARSRYVLASLIRSPKTVAFSSVFCFGFIALTAPAGTPITPQPKMGAPLAGLTAEQLELFNEGRVLYNTPLSVADGLGPVFNKSSCGNCHNNPIGGTGSQDVTRFGRADKGGFDPLDALGGSLLQESGISKTCVEFVPEEANVVSSRITNGALAYGLVEAIDDQDLLDNRDLQPINVQGVAHMVEAFEDPPKSPLHVGRFGWKSQVATVLTFSADAALNEMGLTNRFVQSENAPNGDTVLLAQCDSVADPEDGPDKRGFDFIDRVTHFQRYLGPAPQTPRSGMTGETLFNSIGCAVCHTPSFTTKNDPNLEDAIRNKTIRPYSDFLLHYMGLNGDFIVQGAGIEGLVKTPPLWGLRVRLPMWHDGSVDDDDLTLRLTNAIAKHDDELNAGQGHFAADAFAALSPADQTHVINFLGSLGRMEFDHDVNLNNEIDVFDFLGFADCYTGADVDYAPLGTNPMDHPCAISDVDQDGDVDLDDFGSFLLAYEGRRRDCNSNGIIDLQDILVGTSVDADNNGIPDSCEPTCDQDTNGTGTIDTDDLLTVINQWGSCPAVPAPCAADITNNDIVDVDDLLAIINAWGNCQ